MISHFDESDGERWRKAHTMLVVIDVDLNMYGAGNGNIDWVGPFKAARMEIALLAHRCLSNGCDTCFISIFRSMDWDVSG